MAPVKTVTFFGASLLVGATCWLFFSTAHAAEPTPEFLQTVAAQCNALKTRLVKLESVEVAARIKRGRAYDATLMPFITSFNGRVAANQVDAPELITIAAELQKATSQSQFAQQYTTYANDLSEARQNDCKANPGVTYDWIEKARVDRASLSTQVKKIDALIGEYITQLENLEKRYTPVINAPNDSETPS